LISNSLKAHTSISILDLGKFYLGDNLIEDEGAISISNLLLENKNIRIVKLGFVI